MRLLNFLIYILCKQHTFCSNYKATHDKTCYYYSAAIYCIYIILISYTAFNWTCVMENGDLDITFHMESFFWPVRFIASLIWKLLLIVLNFYNETCRVPAIYSKIEGTYLPIMGAYKKKLGDLGNEGTETKNNRKTESKSC